MCAGDLLGVRQHDTLATGHRSQVLHFLCGLPEEQVGADGRAEESRHGQNRVTVQRHVRECQLGDGLAPGHMSVSHLR